MTAITIDKDKAIELLEKQVEKKGADYIYTNEFDQCMYFADGQTAYKGKYDIDKSSEENAQAFPANGTPLCILGHVYADLGLTVNDLYRAFPYTADAELRRSQSGSLEDIIPDPAQVELTHEAQVVFLEAQHQQDSGETWGTALERAKIAAKEAAA